MKTLFKIFLGLSCLVLIAACLQTSESDNPALAIKPVVVAVPARAGAVEGTTQNSDEFIWRLFTEFAAPVSATNPSPVVFETWASDADTFSRTPAWPDPASPKKFQTSRLLAARSH